MRRVGQPRQGPMLLKLYGPKPGPARRIQARGPARAGFGLGMGCLSKVYVTKTFSNSLFVYSAEGRYMESVGKEGKKELEFDRPTGVAVSSVNNLLYICDYWNNRIQCLHLYN